MKRDPQRLAEDSFGCFIGWSLLVAILVGVLWLFEGRWWAMTLAGLTTIVPFALWQWDRARAKTKSSE